MSRRLVYDRGIDRAFLVEQGADGHEVRTGPLRGRELRAAQAQVTAEQEIEQMRAEIAAQVQAVQHAQSHARAQAQRRTPGRDFGMPVNSDVATRFFVGASIPERFRVGSHPELENT